MFGGRRVRLGLLLRSVKMQRVMQMLKFVRKDDGLVTIEWVGIAAVMVLAAIAISIVLASRPVRWLFRPLIEPNPRWLFKELDDDRASRRDPTGSKRDA